MKWVKWNEWLHTQTQYFKIVFIPIWFHEGWRLLVWKYLQIGKIVSSLRAYLSQHLYLLSKGPNCWVWKINVSSQSCIRYTGPRANTKLTRAWYFSLYASVIIKFPFSMLSLEGWRSIPAQTRSVAWSYNNDCMSWGF